MQRYTMLLRFCNIQPTFFLSISLIIGLIMRFIVSPNQHLSFNYIIFYIVSFCGRIVAVKKIFFGGYYALFADKP